MENLKLISGVQNFHSKLHTMCTTHDRRLRLCLLPSVFCSRFVLSVAKTKQRLLCPQSYMADQVANTRTCKFCNCQYDLAQGRQHGRVFSCTTCASADRVLRQNLGAKGGNLDSFSGEESSKFFRDIHRKKAESPNKRLSWTSLRAMLVSALTQRRIASFKSTLTGKELPLNVWLAKGWPEATVLASQNFWSEKHQCQLYVVDVKETRWSEEFQRVESEVLQHESEAARVRNGKTKKRKSADGQADNPSSEGEMDLPAAKQGEEEKENKNPDKLRKKVVRQNVSLSNRAAKALGPISSSWTSVANLHEKVEKAGVAVPAGVADLYQRTTEKFRSWSEAARAAVNMYESSKQMAAEDVQPLRRKT